MGRPYGPATNALRRYFRMETNRRRKLRFLENIYQGVDRWQRMSFSKVPQHAKDVLIFTFKIYPQRWYDRWGHFPRSLCIECFAGVVSRETYVFSLRSGTIGSRVYDILAYLLINAFSRSLPPVHSVWLSIACYSKSTWFAILIYIVGVLSSLVTFPDQLAQI